MMINWRVRLRNYRFWVSTISLLIVIAQLFGYELPAKAEQAINMALVYFLSQGVLMDPTTAGLGDSERAMSYRAPRRDVLVRVPEDGQDAL